MENFIVVVITRYKNKNIINETMVAILNDDSKYKLDKRVTL